VNRAAILSALAFALVLPCSSAAADFVSDVRPVFASRCFECHGPDKQRGGLRLDRKADALQGGDSGPAITPGKSGDSLLIRKISSTDAQERMPPKGDPLTAAQIQSLKSWIDAGATWPPDDASSVHWSFKPVEKPAVPQIRNPQSGYPRERVIRNPIDAFIISRLTKSSLSPSPPADRPALIRRLKFDLLGLPPTPEEIDAFTSDRSTDAYEKLVDRFLASPQYGERWARHWLDVVRFAESNGFETNLHRPNAWQYRDYVIQSFNDDKPYDKFVAEQLAGDALGADAATGFLVAGPYDLVKSPDVVLTSQQRADELHDMVATAGSTFLGLTIGCARCHNHKFDPILQKDYYAVKALFAGVQHGERPIEDAKTKPVRLARVAELRRQLAQVERELEAAEPLADTKSTEPRRAPVHPRRNVERFEPVRARFIRFTVVATNNLEPCIDELEVFTSGAEPNNVALASAGAKATASGTFAGSDRHKLEHINDGRYGNSRSWISNEVAAGWVQIELSEPATIDRIKWARDREGEFKDRLPTRYRIEVALEPGDWKLVATSDDRQSVAGASKDRPAVAGVSDPGRAKTGVADPGYSTLVKRWSDLQKQARDAEKPPMVYAGKFTTPEPTFRFHRGDAMQKREPVAPAGVAAIAPKLELPIDAPERERRLALARWITDPANPLTARVLVNRLWHYHFGTGIVATPSDLGHKGAAPTHPELLDWLAAEFMAHGWSVKHIQRLIVTSGAYRQSSAADERGLAADAQSRLLWRYPPRRLEAEAIRDAILAVSGNLDLRMGGPGFDLFDPNDNYVKVYTPKKSFGPAEWRRMIYQSRPRMQPDDTFGAFDCPDGGQIAPKRTVSTTPLQALNLLNSPFLLEQANLFAERLRREAPVVAGVSDPGPQVRRGFRLAFGREPSAEEQTAAVDLVKEHGLPALCRALFNANEFLFVP
jgi:mono/diheme cytochrome c family protein